MVVQEGLQRRMILHPASVFDQRRVLAKLLRDFRVAIQETIEYDQISVIDAVLFSIRVTVLVAVFAGVLSSIHIRLALNDAPAAVLIWSLLSTCRNGEAKQWSCSKDHCP